MRARSVSSDRVLVSGLEAHCHHGRRRHVIITGMILVVLAGAAKIILGGKGRPSLCRTFLGLPLVVIGLSFPFLLEEGCWVPYNRTHVVTRDADGILTKHGLVAWCPRGCVNVPQEITVHLTVRKNLVYKFEVFFTVESPQLLVRYLELDAEDQVYSSPDVETATSQALRPLLDGYFASPGGSSYLNTDEKSFECEAVRDDLSSFFSAFNVHGGWGPVWKGVSPSGHLFGMGLAFSGLRGKIVGVATQ